MPEPTATAPIPSSSAASRFSSASTVGIGHTGVLEAVDVTARERIAARRVTQVECGRGIDWRHSGTAVIQRLVAGVDGLRSEINVH